MPSSSPARLALLLFAAVAAAHACRTTGGYVTEATACAFPFTYNGQKYTSCADTASAPPYVAKTKPPPGPYFGNLSASWCATVPAYASTGPNKKFWGYCDCGLAGCSPASNNVVCAFAPPPDGCKAPGKWTFAEAQKACAVHGARLCSSTELANEKIAKGSCPMANDDSRLVWSLDICPALTPQGAERHLAVPGNGKGLTQCVNVGKFPLDSARCCRTTEIPGRPRSILFVIIDDLRPDLNLAYGRNASKSPNLDLFAASPGTVVFERAFTSFPLCSPSRMTFLTGRLPDRSKYGLNAVLRTTPTKFFKSLGYTSTTGGKVFHEGQDDNASWSSHYFDNVDQYAYGGGCNGPKTAPVFESSPPYQAVVPTQICQFTGDISTMLDYVLLGAAMNQLQTFASRPLVPFWMAVGFYRPHLPLQIHKDYWNIVGLVPDAENFNGPQPRSSFTPYFPDADPSLSTAGGNPNSPWGGNVVPSEWRRIVRSAYAAGVAQTDAAVGKLLSRLDELGLASSTMVIIAGDNGFFLGETGQWNKDALFDQADRVPLIVRVPWLNDSRPVGTIKRSRRFFDLVDLYPTSAALLSVANKLQPDLDGVDKSAYILEALQGEQVVLDPGVNASYSQVVRCDIGVQCERAGNNSAPIRVMGYSVRTDLYRYVVWLTAPLGVVDWHAPLVGQELYSHSADNQTLFNYKQGASFNVDNYNLAPVQPQVCAELFALVKAKFFPLNPAPSTG